MRTNILTPKTPEVKPILVHLKPETERALHDWRNLRDWKNKQRQQRQIERDEDVEAVGEGV